MKAKPRTLYHCTQVDHGDTLTVAKMPPINRGKGEPDTPRLCASPTVPQCLAASLLRFDRPIHIYATPTKVKGVTPKDVWDEVITMERWLLPGQTLTKRGEISAETRRELYAIPTVYHSAEIAADARTRVASMALMRDVIPAHFPRWFSNLLDAWLKTLGIEDPFDPFIKGWEERFQVAQNQKSF